MNQKPISMAINETRISLLKICNESQLPSCVLELIIKDLYNDVNRVSEVQLKQDEENYVKASKDVKNANNKQKQTKKTE